MYKYIIHRYRYIRILFLKKGKGKSIFLKKKLRKYELKTEESLP